MAVVRIGCCVSLASEMFGEQIQVFCQTLQIRFYLSAVALRQPKVYSEHISVPHTLIKLLNESTVRTKMSWTCTRQESLFRVNAGCVL